MPTIITHAAVPLAAAAALELGRIPARLAVAGAVLAMLPDADVAGFKLGIAYADPWGHRGATHSLAIAAVCASLVTLMWPTARSVGAWAFLFAAMASHGLLDMLTSGGLGVALFWPVETARHFFALTPIRVSPIGGNFFTQRGLITVWSELGWVWAPLAGVVGLARLLRWSHRSRAR